MTPTTQDAGLALLPCPFCGGADIRIDAHPRAGRGEHHAETVFSMCCYACGATFPNRYRRELLVTAWNTRAPLADRLEALSQAVNAPQGEAVAWRYRTKPHRQWFFTIHQQTAEAEIADGSEVQALYASPALAEPEGWRGIESAPTDGRNVLVFCPRASDHGYERIRLTWRKDGKWQGANNTSWPPTHWMPLPPAPEGT